MAFEDNSELFKAPPEVVTEKESFSVKLSSDRMKIREIVKTFSDDAEAIYLAGIYVLQMENFPAKQSIVSHCFRELINALVRYSEIDCKEQIREALQDLEFSKNSGHSGEHMQKLVNELWNVKDAREIIKKIYNERGKLKNNLLDHNIKLKVGLSSSDENTKQKTADYIESIATDVIVAKKNIDGLRHLNNTFKTIPSDEFFDCILTLENYIIELEQPNYLKKKEGIDGILEEANSRAD